MRHLSVLTFVLVVTLLAPQLPGQSPDSQTSSTADSATGSEEDLSPAGAALSTIFSPTRAPKRKTMGLLQRSFLDLADQGERELQLAIVVDGTNSMATELAGVRKSILQMLEDLQRVRNNEVQVALVIYRDVGDGSTEELEAPLPKFISASEKEVISKAVQRLQPQSGKPYFNELPDLGLYYAIEELDWSQDDQVAKWILLFGDAPPYSESANNLLVPEAKRRYATQILISAARSENIRINCMLCTSSDNVSQAYRDAVADTRSFMTALANGTDGLMLDLSFEQTRTAMVNASKQPEVSLTEIQPIQEIDLAAVRRETGAASTDIRQVSLAVLPHFPNPDPAGGRSASARLPISKISFDPRRPEVRVSTALRTRLAEIPGVRVASPRLIEEQLRRLEADGISEDKAIQGLAARLGVEFVVWGSLLPDATVQTAAYRRDGGQQIAPIKLAKNSDDWAYTLISKSATGASGDKAFQQLVQNMGLVEKEITAPIAKNPATTQELLTALEALEQALGHEAGSNESVELLKTADKASNNAIQAENTNAIAYWLQANVAYNQAAQLYRNGDEKDADARMRDMKFALQDAYEYRDQVANKSLVTEIEADHALLIENNYEQAIELYKKLTDRDQALKSQLRGHWMLAGLYAGDWGSAGTKVVNPPEARRHVSEILANWPESPETELLKIWLRWDDTRDETTFNFLPQMNTGLL